MLWRPLRRIGWKRNKGPSEDTWRKMASSTNLSILKNGLTLLLMEIQTLNILKMILFNISTTASISRKIERIKIGVVSLIFFQTNSQMELKTQKSSHLMKMKMRNLISMMLKNTRGLLPLIDLAIFRFNIG